MKTRKHFDIWQLMRGQILSAAIIHMFCRESKNIKVRISYTALEISALVEMHIQVVWTL